MTFSLRMLFLVITIMILLTIGYGELRYLNGGYAHADHIKALADQKKNKATKAVQVGEQKATRAASESKVIYRTITRDVVKYVQDPNCTRCDFDDESIRLCQRAIDAANRSRARQVTLLPKRRRPAGG